MVYKTNMHMYECVFLQSLSEMDFHAHSCKLLCILLILTGLQAVAALHTGAQELQLTGRPLLVELIVRLLLYTCNTVHVYSL